jgi:hypothetical protein
MIFGDWATIEPATRMQNGFFIMWTFTTTLLMSNILIAQLSETYTRIYDSKVKASYTELVQLVLQLEILFFWNREKIENCHLLYAEVIEEGEKEDDITTGIGEKIFNLGNKLKTQIAQVTT